MAALSCPETLLPLQVAPAELVSLLNDLIARGALTNKKGEAIKTPLDSALLREDRALFYPVREDIPDLLIEEGIVIPWEQIGGKERWE